MRILFLIILVIFLLMCSGCISQAEDWYRQGETHFALGRYEEAVVAYDQAVTLDPGYAKAWSHRGLSLSYVGRAQDSDDSFSKALSLAPDDIETHYFQALARNKTGKLAEARESLEQAIVLRPRSRDNTIILASCLMLHGDLLSLEGHYEEANASYHRAHEVMMSTL